MEDKEFLKVTQQERLVEFALRASVVRWLRSCIRNSNGSYDDRRMLKDKTISLIQYDKAINLNFYR